MPSPDHKLPDNLHDKIKVFRSRLWKIKIIEAIISGILGFFLSYLILFISDRIWATPPGVSLIILIAGSVLFFFFAPYWIHRWIWKRRHNSQLAKLIANKYPELGDRILGVVELENEENGKISHSIELKNAAITQVAQDAEDVDFSQAIPNPRHKKVLAAFFILLGILLLLGIFVPEASMNAFKRWSMPTSDIPRYTFTRLVDVPKELYVPSGESFKFSIIQDKSSKLLSDSARARCNGVINLVSPFHEGEKGELRAEFQFPGLLEESLIYVEAGDARHEIRVIPSLRPNLDDLYAEVIYPEYTTRSQEKVPVKTGTLYAVEGSNVQLHAISTNPLSSASFFDAEGNEKTLEVEANRVRFPQLKMDQSSKISFQWTDVHNLPAHSPFKINLEALPDQAPDVYLQGTSREIYLLEKESVELTLLSSDDFGVRHLGIEWVGPQSNGSQILSKGAPTQAHLNAKYVFHAESLGIKPQRIFLYAIASDYKPGRENKKSSPITIYVLSKNEHAQMIKSELEQITASLEELAQQEQLLIDESARLKQKNINDLITSENRSTLKELEEGEKSHAKRLKELMDELSTLFQKASRNDEIDSKSLHPFYEAKELLNKLPQTSQKEAQEALKRAAEANNTPEKTSQELSNAQEQQQKTLEAINSALKKLNESSENLESGTFIARLKKTARQERQILDFFLSGVDRLMGETPSAIDPKDKREIDKSAQTQKDILHDIYWISDDLKHFFLRSKIELHNNVAQEMHNFLMNSAIENLPSIMEKNHSAQSIEMAQGVETNLLKWVKMIEGSDKKKKNNQAGGGSGQDSESMSESDFDFMLKVMRMIQSQQDIRSRTRMLEEEKEKNSPQKPHESALSNDSPTTESTDSEENATLPTQPENNA